MEINEDEYLAHYGTPRHSGRYPWGSGGEETNTRNKDLLDRIDILKKQGLTEVQIAQGMGMTTTELRKQKSNAKTQEKQAQIDMAFRLKEKGLSNVAAAERMGIPESSYRALINPGANYKADVLEATTSVLRKKVDEDGLLDVGRGVEQYMGVSSTKLNNAVALLQDQGYAVHYVDIEQVGTGKKTNMKILCPPGTTYGEVQKNKANIKHITSFSEDGGSSYLDIKPPLAVHTDRVGVIYGPDGGAKSDGVIYVRPGVSDIALGGAKYAQVRVQVGDSHYLKGMAMYKDGMPEGVDLQFNTNKKDTGNKLDALKPIDKESPDNPFGTFIRRQIIDPDTKELTSSMNIVYEEGNWLDWSKSIATQVLSKQSPGLAREQLKQSYESRVADYDAIMALTNPVVKKKMLKAFAESTDSASVHLKAAALPRQGWHVILPMPTINEHQIYAPNYIDGERVVLIRYPHGGTFEIPELTVNNNHAPARKVLGQARDAVAIHPKVAERLSGADFDGDTVLVIPNNQKKIKITPALDALKDFDPRASYPEYDGMTLMKPSNKGLEMGLISNLITDMTIKTAPHSDIARAVRHSMVVIDAVTHKLDWKQSAIDNNIAQLKEKYQEGATKGASTLISKAKGIEYIPRRNERRASKGGPIDPSTGRKVFEETGELNFKTGKPRLQLTKKLAEVDDAHSLSSGTRIEGIYADHSNRLKTLANTARLSYLRTPKVKYSPTAKKVYESEVSSLDSKLALAKRNAPLERQAQLLANSMISAKKASNPSMDKATEKKIKGQALIIARVRTGAKKNLIEISPKEWEAIQAGAISESKLTQILDNANLDIVKELATPRTKVLMSPAKMARAESMFANGATRAEVAAQLGVSLSTLDESVQGSTA